jgi:hypothetical protein
MARPVIAAHMLIGPVSCRVPSDAHPQKVWPCCVVAAPVHTLDQRVEPRSIGRRAIVGPGFLFTRCRRRAAGQCVIPTYGQRKRPALPPGPRGRSQQGGPGARRGVCQTIGRLDECTAKDLGLPGSFSHI